MSKKTVVVVDGGHISLERIAAVAKGEARVSVGKDPQFIKRMERAQALVVAAVQNDVPLYGVNTGFGKSCGKRIPVRTNYGKVVSPIAFHGCGTGEPLGSEETRAAMLCRMICLARGNSGVSIELFEQMASFLNLGITPVVPAEGSVGASGDLTPMSYIAACRP